MEQQFRVSKTVWATSATEAIEKAFAAIREGDESNTEVTELTEDRNAAFVSNLTPPPCKEAALRPLPQTPQKSPNWGYAGNDE